MSKTETLPSMQQIHSLMVKTKPHLSEAPITGFRIGPRTWRIEYEFPEGWASFEGRTAKAIKMLADPS